MNKSGKDWVLSHLDEAAQSRRCTDVRQVRSQCLGSWEKADGLLFFLIHRNLKDNKDLNKENEALVKETVSPENTAETAVK